MDSKYYLGGGLIKFSNQIKNLQTILEINNGKIEELHIIEDPFPDLTIDSIINQTGEFDIVEDIPLKEISRIEYEQLIKESKRFMKF